MGIKSLIIYVKIFGNKRIFVIKEICMNTPTRPKFRHSEELLVSESEDLEIIKKTLKKISIDLREDSFFLTFDLDRTRYKPIPWVEKLFNALEPGSVSEELEILGKITNKEKEGIISDLGLTANPFFTVTVTV